MNHRCLRITLQLISLLAMHAASTAQDGLNGRTADLARADQKAPLQSARDRSSAFTFLTLVLNDDVEGIQRFLLSQPLPKLPNVNIFKAAVHRGNEKVVEVLIKAGADLNEQGLICAALPNPTLTQRLLSLGVATEGNICAGLSPLQLASKRGYQDTVRILLSGTPDVPTAAASPSISSAGLFEAAMAANIPIMTMMLDKGWKLGAKEIKEVTQRNCMGGNLAALKLLQEKGLTPDYDRCYLFLSWIEKPHPELLKWLQSQSPVTKFEIDGQPLINAAANRGNLLMARFLIEAGSRLDLRDAQYKYSALGAALTPEQVSRPLRMEMAELLLSKGANPNLPEGRNGRTLLEELARTVGCPSDDRSYQAIWAPRVRAMELLIRYGADVNLVDRNNGNTPLHYAVKSGNPDLVRLLLEQRAAVDAMNRDGYTPLYYLVAGSRGCWKDEEIVQAMETLIAHGADTTRELKGKKLVDLVDRSFPGGDALRTAILRLTAERSKAAPSN